MIKPRKRGPRPKPSREVRSVTITTVVTPSEANAIREAAGDTPVSTWLREQALRAMDPSFADVASLAAQADRTLQEAKDLSEQVKKAIREHQQPKGKEDR